MWHSDGVWPLDYEERGALESFGRVLERLGLEWRQPRERVGHSTWGLDRHALVYTLRGY